MATLRAPFKNGMRLGMGFNSYTQSTCLNEAVGIKSTVTPADRSNRAQTVSYKSAVINHLSDITESLNVAGSVEIKYGPISGGGAGSYVDASRFKDSDLNFSIQVNVINQQVLADQRTEQFNVLSNVTPGNFTSIYGDTYISGFEEGGIFQAVVSMKFLDKSKKESIEAKAHVAFSGLEGGLDASGEVKKARDEISQQTDIEIFVHWAGGGQVKEAGARWTIDELIDAASRFPKLCADTPQITFAILNKYIFLSSFQKLVHQISPLSYENAAAYTNILLDDYIDYKQTLKDINSTIEGLLNKSIEFLPGPSESPESPVKDAFEPSIQGMLDAKDDALAQMTAISNLVDNIAEKPEIIKTLVKPNPKPYVDSQKWKFRLPATRASATLAPVQTLDPSIFVRKIPTIMVLPDGQHELFAQAADGFLWHKILAPDQGPVNANIWEYQGDNVPLSSDSSPKSAITGTQENLQKFCFVVGADSKLYQKSGAPDGKWSFLRVLDAAKTMKCAGGLAVLGQKDRLDLCAIGLDGRMHWSFLKGGNWSKMVRIGDALHKGVPQLVVNGADGSLNLFSSDLDSQIMFNCLPSGSSSWTGWQIVNGSWLQCGTSSIVWPQAPGDFATQLDFFSVGEPRNSVWELQVVHGKWAQNGAGAQLNKDHLRSAVTAVSLEPGREEFFAIAEHGMLWQSTWNNAAGKGPRDNWRMIANGPFLSLQPLAVVLPTRDLVVYVVDVEGKVVRLLSQSGSFTDGERV